MFSAEFTGAQHKVWNVLVGLRRAAAILSILILTSCGSDSSFTPTSAVSLSVTQHIGLTLGQKISLTVTTSNATAIAWSITPSGGSFSSAKSQSGQAVTFTAPSTAGTYTVTASNVSDGSTISSATVGVTDLSGVYTYHNDLARTGVNASEYSLTPANVNATNFGKLFSCSLDGATYAQPLWAANVTISGQEHNVVFVATGHDSVFAFDADASPCQTLWAASLLDVAHGATPGETTVPSKGPGALVAGFTPETGITGTPVIDPESHILYVVSSSVDSTKSNIYVRLHAIDLSSGKEKPGSPVTINATYAGAGDGGTSVAFNPRDEFQRAGLALVNGTVIITWASYGDIAPYYGWVIGYKYDGQSFTQSYVLNVTPNVGYGGIWMAGGAPAADEAGNVYLITGNGGFDANNAGPMVNNDYGDSLLQLTPQLSVSQYFTPSDQALDVTNDSDFGGGGALLVTLPPTSPVSHLIVGGGKDGTLSILNRDSLGGYGDEHAWQQIPINGPILATPAFWNNTLYISGTYTALNAYQLDTSTALFQSSPSVTPTIYGIGSSPSISALGNSNGIVWVLDNGNTCNAAATTPQPGGPAVLSAYDASNLGNMLWTSSSSTADTLGNAVTFTTPTVANGKVYVGTRGTGPAACSLTSVTGELDVYGLKN